MAKPATAWLVAQGFQVRREVGTSWGICDIVGVQFNQKRIELRVQHGQTKSIGSSLKVALLNEIPDEKESKSIRFETLSKKFGSFIGKNQLTSELEDLLSKKFIRAPRKNLFQKINGWVPLHEKIVAVELKLSRIKEVILQAQANLEFADESYAALPPDKCNRILREDLGNELVSKGIGLLEVSENGTREVIPSSGSKHSQNKIAQMSCIEQFWSSRYKQLTMNV